MGKIRCNARGCTGQLWIPRVGLEGTESSATCDSCKQVALCVNHFSVLWKRGDGCPKCGSKRWTVHLFEGTAFSPIIQAELMAEGGQLKMIDLPSDQSSGQHSTSNTPQVMINIAARSQQQLRHATLTPSPPLPSHTEGANRDPYQNTGSLIEAAEAQEVTWSGKTSVSHPSAPQTLPPPPRGWRLITQKDLSNRARGLGEGIAIERETDHLLRMMDDDRIIRHIHLDGDVLSISQSPRKQRLIVERSLDGLRQMLYIRNKDIQGFITNPVLDEGSIFGARFVNETMFVVLVERPDGRIDLREGRFERARRVQTRVVGTSFPGTPLPPSPCNKGHLVFLFKELSEGRYLPICRRISNGEDTVIGSELLERPMLQASSQDSMTIAWVTQRGRLWVSGGVQHPTACVYQEGADMLVTSSDGRHVAWSNEWGFFTYNLDLRKIERWSQPEGLLTIGWRG